MMVAYAKRLVGVLGLLACCACDWEHSALLNSVPVHSRAGHNPLVRVYIAVDGLAHHTLEDVRQHGAFPAAEGWKAARSIAVFPATSDACWSRILGSAPMGGYEYSYYDAEEDEVINDGYWGLLSHAIPPIDGLPIEEPPYYAAFDYHANGYLNTLWNYSETQLSLNENLDQLFFILAGHAETNPVFTAYLIELDVMGHMHSPQDVRAALLRLFRRIQTFKAAHPERRFVFTLFSDHGNDFMPAGALDLLDFRSVMSGLGVAPVDSYAEGAALDGPYAVPIQHTRVSYLALHTPMAEEVARLTSRSPTTEIVVARSDQPDMPETGWEETSTWFSVWNNGQRLLHAGHDPSHQRYHLKLSDPADVLGLAALATRDGYATFADDILFEHSSKTPFPDLFHRARTALEPIAGHYPADVVISFKRPHASQGFAAATGLASAGFHGAMETRGSSGVVLTEEDIPLPATMRSDDVLKTFPELRKHLKAKGLFDWRHAEDRNAR